jgi:hypothetical protein
MIVLIFLEFLCKMYNLIRNIDLSFIGANWERPYTLFLGKCNHGWTCMDCLHLHHSEHLNPQKLNH